MTTNSIMTGAMETVQEASDNIFEKTKSPTEEREERKDSVRELPGFADDFNRDSDNILTCSDGSPFQPKTINRSSGVPSIQSRDTVLTGGNRNSVSRLVSHPSGNHIDMEFTVEDEDPPVTTIISGRNRQSSTLIEHVKSSDKGSHISSLGSSEEHGTRGMLPQKSSNNPSNPSQSNGTHNRLMQSSIHQTITFVGSNKSTFLVENYSCVVQIFEMHRIAREELRRGKIE
jgi:hypothetical protein